MNELLYKDIKTGRFSREFSHSFIHTEKGLISSINTEFIKLNHKKKKKVLDNFPTIKNQHDFLEATKRIIYRKLGGAYVRKLSINKNLVIILCYNLNLPQK